MKRHVSLLVLAVSLVFAPSTSASASPISSPVLIDTINVSGAMARLSPDGARLYVIDGFGRKIQVVDTSSKEVLSSLTIPSSSTVDQYLDAVVSPDGRTLYLANNRQNDNSRVLFVDVSNDLSISIRETVLHGRGAHGIAVTPDGSKIYVTNFFVETVSVIDTTTLTVTTVPAVSTETGDFFMSPQNVVVSPDGTKYYVVYYKQAAGPGESGLVSFSVADNSIIEKKEAPAGLRFNAIALSPDGESLYLATFTSGSSASNKVEKLSLTDLDTPIWSKIGDTNPWSDKVMTLGVSGDGNTLYSNVSSGALHTVRGSDGSAISANTGYNSTRWGLAVPKDPSARFIYAAGTIGSPSVGIVRQIGEAGITPFSQRVSDPLGSTFATTVLTANLAGVITYSSSELPSGLTIDPLTGQVSGTLPSLTDDTVITITASNGSTTLTAKLTILATVENPAPETETEVEAESTSTGPGSTTGTSTPASASVPVILAATGLTSNISTPAVAAVLFLLLIGGVLVSLRQRANRFRFTSNS